MEDMEILKTKFVTSVMLNMGAATVSHAAGLERAFTW
jgi:hypothetical protein